MARASVNERKAPNPLGGLPREHVSWLQLLAAMAVLVGVGAVALWFSFHNGFFMFRHFWQRFVG